MKELDKCTIKLLSENWILLQKSLESLKRSVEKASLIEEKSDFTFEEMETFDSLTSKFSRTSDIFMQKVLRSVWKLMHEDIMPFIDMLNKAEKMGIIASADILIQIRDMRNQIAHEYIPEAIQELIPEVIELFAELEINIGICAEFLDKRDWIAR